VVRDVERERHGGHAKPVAQRGNGRGVASTSTTRQPASTSRLAVAAPMPLAAPVMSATPGLSPSFRGVGVDAHGPTSVAFETAG